jgi:phage tail sheath protein FI
LRGVFDLEYQTDAAKQGDLNPKGVNVIRQFPGRGIRVWGARTLSDNSLWKYVSVRRLFIFLEHSLYEGTQWVVFEPNDEKLWARVKDTIRLFLRTQWRNGAMMGLTEDEAFTIACDRSTMTQDDILNGRLICEIGIAPVRPAEFVILRIFQNTAEAKG